MIVKLALLAILATYAFAQCSSYNTGTFLTNCYGCQVDSNCDICYNNASFTSQCVDAGSCASGSTVLPECDCSGYTNCLQCATASDRCNWCSGNAFPSCLSNTFPSSVCAGAQNTSDACPDPCQDAPAADVCSIGGSKIVNSTFNICPQINTPPQVNCTNSTSNCTISEACGGALLNWACSFACAPCSKAATPTFPPCQSTCDGIQTDCATEISDGCVDPTFYTCTMSTNCSDVSVGTIPPNPCGPSTTGVATTGTTGAPATTGVATTATATSAGTTTTTTTGTNSTTTTGATSAAATTGKATTGKASTSDSSVLSASAILVVLAICSIFA